MFNKAILIGRLGKDPELSYTQSGTARCKFSLATSESYTDSQTGERKEKTVWHNIIVWGKQGENADKYLRKGSRCAVDGKIDNRSYEKDGQTRYITEIIAHRVTFLDTKSEGGGQQGGGRQGGGRQGGGRQGGGRQGDGQRRDEGQSYGGGYGPADDDIPF